MASTRIRLPGSGRPVNYYDHHPVYDALPSALNPIDMIQGRTT